MNSKKFFDALGMNGTRWQWRMMLWEKKLKQTFRAPVYAGGWQVNQILIGINLVWYLLVVVKGTISGLGLFTSAVSPDTYLLLYAGGQLWPLVIFDGEWWRCITYAFVHGGILHLVFNMVVLYQVGPLIEYEIGRSRFITLYLFATLTATGLDYLWHPNVPVVGASGALFGLIGFAILWYHRLGDRNSLELRNFMLKWALFSFIFGILVGADHAAHLGGAAGGALFGAILPVNAVLRRRTDRFFAVLGGISTLLIAAAFAGVALSWFR